MADLISKEEIDNQIDNMQAGMEMNCLVAKVLRQTTLAHPSFSYQEGVTEDGSDGWSGFYCPRCGAAEGDSGPCVLSYSTSIVNAWRVVEWWLVYQGDLFIEWWQDGEWFISNENLFNRKDKSLRVICAKSDQTPLDSGDLPSFPLAICRMAIKMGIEKGLLKASDLKVEAKTDG